MGRKKFTKALRCFRTLSGHQKLFARKTGPRQGWSLLDVAIEDRNLEMVRVMLNEGLEPRINSDSDRFLGMRAYLQGPFCRQLPPPSLLSFVFEQEEALGEVVMQLEAWRTNITYGILMQSQHVEAIERIVRTQVGILDMVGGMDLGNIKARKRLLEFIFEKVPGPTATLRELRVLFLIQCHIPGKNPIVLDPVADASQIKTETGARLAVRRLGKTLCRFGEIVFPRHLPPSSGQPWEYAFMGALKDRFDLKMVLYEHLEFYLAPYVPVSPPWIIRMIPLPITTTLALKLHKNMMAMDIAGTERVVSHAVHLALRDLHPDMFPSKWLRTAPRGLSPIVRLADRWTPWHTAVVMGDMKSLAGCPDEIRGEIIELASHLRMEADQVRSMLEVRVEVS